MGTYKRTMRNMLLATFMLADFFPCHGQVKVDIERANELIVTRDSAVNARFVENLNSFRESGRASILISNPEYYKRLRSYSQEIRERLFPCYKGCKSSSYNRQVLGLLDLPQYMKDSLLNFKYTEPEVRVAVGDTSVQNEAIRQYRIFLSTDMKT